MKALTLAAAAVLAAPTMATAQAQTTNPPPERQAPSGAPSTDAATPSTATAQPQTTPEAAEPVDPGSDDAEQTPAGDPRPEDAATASSAPSVPAQPTQPSPPSQGEGAPTPAQPSERAT